MKATNVQLTAASHLSQNRVNTLPNNTPIHAISTRLLADVDNPRIRDQSNE